MDAVKVGGGSLVSYAFELCVREPEAPCKELRVWVSAGKGPDFSFSENNCRLGRAPCVDSECEKFSHFQMVSCILIRAMILQRYREKEGGSPELRSIYHSMRTYDTGERRDL